MATAEVSGFIELGRWCALPDDTEIYLESTDKVRRFRIRKRPRERRPTSVRHRRIDRENLTSGEKSDTD